MSKRERAEERVYRGALILLYTFLGIVIAVWFTVYVIFMIRGPVG
ncbi:MAG: hypothetical protein RQ885_10415 [Desulfurococcales archaeon]|nr:hypothetical protein [Desulfurococcales archaeon]